MMEHKHTEGSALERIEQWIYLCECTNATGEGTEIMEQAASEIRTLKAEVAKLREEARAVIDNAKPVYATASNTASVRSGHELSGYVKYNKVDQYVLNSLQQALNKGE